MPNLLEYAMSTGQNYFDLQNQYLSPKGAKSSSYNPQTAQTVQNLYNQDLNSVVSGFSPVDYNGQQVFTSAAAPAPSSSSYSVVSSSSAAPQSAAASKKPATPTLESLYQTVLGRAPDQAGYDFWNKALQSGVSMDHIQSQFYGSDEYKGLQASKSTTPAPVMAPSVTVSNPAPTPAAATTPAQGASWYSGMSWNDLIKKAQPGYQRALDNSNTDGGIDPVSGAWIDMGGNRTQVYLPMAPDRNDGGNGDPNFDRWGNAVFNYHDAATPKDFMTSLYRNKDGSIGSVTRKSDSDKGFLSDMAKFALAATGMNLGINGLAGVSGGAPATGGTSGWTSGYDLAGGSALPTGAGTAGLDVSQFGLDQFTDGMPELETLGTTTDGGLAYPGQPGYIPPTAVTPSNVNPTDYSNEGRNYPTPESTVTSPINATTGPGAAPTIPLTPATPTAPSVPAGPKLPVTPSVPGTSTGTKGGSMDLGTILSLLYGAYGKNKMSNQFQGILDEMRGMYKPGSPEAELMRKKIEARDAAKGRRSQYGPRETELAGMLADSRMRMLSSPGFMTMQAAQMNNDPSMNGLSEIFGALSKNGGPLNGVSLNDLFNTGILDGEGWTVDAKNWVTSLFD